MGMIKCKVYVDNVMVNNILLGQPSIVKDDGTRFSAGDSIENLWFAWDDPAIPNGTGEVISGEFIFTPDSAGIV